MKNAIKLPDTESAELSRRAVSRTRHAEYVCRTRVILLLWEELTWDEVMERLDCSLGFVATWASISEM